MPPSGPLYTKIQQKNWENAVDNQDEILKKIKCIKRPAYRQRSSILNDFGSTIGKVVLLGWLLPAVFFQFLIAKYALNKQFLSPPIFFVFFTHNFCTY